MVIFGGVMWKIEFGENWRDRYGLSGLMNPATPPLPSTFPEKQGGGELESTFNFHRAMDQIFLKSKIIFENTS